MFIDLFVGQVNLWAVGDDQRELHPLRTWVLALREHPSDSRQHQLADGRPAGGGLCFELSVERCWNVNGCTNGIRFHSLIIPCVSEGPSVELDLAKQS